MFSVSSWPTCKVMFELGESLGQCDHHHCQEFNMPKLKSSFIPFAHCDCFHGFAVKKCIKPQKVEPFFLASFVCNFENAKHTRTQVYLHILLKHIYVKPMGISHWVYVNSHTLCVCSGVWVCVFGKKHLTLTWACTFSPKSSLTLPHARCPVACWESLCVLSFLWPI